MKVLVVGGGSGGHVTPAIAVIREIRKKQPKCEIRFWSDYNFFNNARSLISEYDPSISVSKIVAGKFRRYSHLSLFGHLLLPKQMLLNLRDIFYFIIGIFHSFIKLLIWRPDVIFAKGGYVCLAVGFSARILNIPIVIHDSDVHPGLTNRIISKWARSIATGSALENYNYPKNKTFYVGVPIGEDFRVHSKKEQESAKLEWGMKASKKLIVVTGGGLGANKINMAIARILHDITDKYNLVLISGSSNYKEMRSLVPENNETFQMYPFVSSLEMSSLFTAADLVIARAGATTILELSAMAKPTVLIPNKKLTGNHQQKNAEFYAKKKSVLVIDEDDLERNPIILKKVAKEILDNEKMAENMTENFLKLSKPNAARDVANLILK